MISFPQASQKHPSIECVDGSIPYSFVLQVVRALVEFQERQEVIQGLHAPILEIVDGPFLAHGSISLFSELVDASGDFFHNVLQNIHLLPHVLQAAAKRKKPHMGLVAIAIRIAVVMLEKPLLET